jgi:hypothetical protein
MVLSGYLQPPTIPCYYVPLLEGEGMAKKERSGGRASLTAYVSADLQTRVHEAANLEQRNVSGMAAVLIERALDAKLVYPAVRVTK